MSSVGAIVFEAFPEPEDMPRTRMTCGLGLEALQNVQLEGVLLVPMKIGREDLEGNVSARASNTNQISRPVYFSAWKGLTASYMQAIRWNKHRTRACSLPCTCRR